MKQRFRALDDDNRAQVDDARGRRFRLVTRKAVQAGDAEIARNPRARNARLRVLERCA